MNELTLSIVGRPDRDITITTDEILNLIILLNTTTTVSQFLEAIA